jgi:hypothetical protein
LNQFIVDTMRAFKLKFVEQILVKGKTLNQNSIFDHPLKHATTLELLKPFCH